MLQLASCEEVPAQVAPPQEVLGFVQDLEFKESCFLEDLFGLSIIICATWFSSSIYLRLIITISCNLVLPTIALQVPHKRMKSLYPMAAFPDPVWTCLVLCPFPREEENKQIS